MLVVLLLFQAFEPQHFRNSEILLAGCHVIPLFILTGHVLFEVVGLWIK